MLLFKKNSSWFLYLLCANSLIYNYPLNSFEAIKVISTFLLDKSIVSGEVDTKTSHLDTL